MGNCTSSKGIEGGSTATKNTKGKPSSKTKLATASCRADSSPNPTKKRRKKKPRSVSPTAPTNTTSTSTNSKTANSRKESNVLGAGRAHRRQNNKQLKQQAAKDSVVYQEWLASFAPVDVSTDSTHIQDTRCDHTLRDSGGVVFQGWLEAFDSVDASPSSTCSRDMRRRKKNESSSNNNDNLDWLTKLTTMDACTNNNFDDSHTPSSNHAIPCEHGYTNSSPQHYSTPSAPSESYYYHSYSSGSGGGGCDYGGGNE